MECKGCHTENDILIKDVIIDEPACVRVIWNCPQCGCDNVAYVDDDSWEVG